MNRGGTNPFAKNPFAPAPPPSSFSAFALQPLASSGPIALSSLHFIQDDLILTSEQETGSGAPRVSRRELTRTGWKVDGSIALNERPLRVLVSAKGEHGLICYRNSAYYMNLHGATLKTRLLTSLSDATLTCMSEPLVGTVSGSVLALSFDTKTGVRAVKTLAAKQPALAVEVFFQESSRSYVVFWANGRYQSGILSEEYEESSSSGMKILPNMKENDAVVSVIRDDEDEDVFWILTQRGELNRLERRPDGEAEEVRAVVSTKRPDRSSATLAQTALYVCVLIVSGSNTAPTTTCLLVSKLTNSVVAEDAHLAQVYEAPVAGIVSNPVRSASYAFSSRGLAEVHSASEGGVDGKSDVWKQALEIAKASKRPKDFERALRWCRGRVAAEDEVWSAYASREYDAGHHQKAAEYWSKVQSPTSSYSFERVALKLSSADTQPRALRWFLLHRLEEETKKKAAGRRAAAQHVVVVESVSTMLALWLVEVFLQDMQREESEEDVVAMWEFLHAQKDALDPVKETVFHLFSTHARVDLLLFYANLVDDLRVVVQHHLQRGAPEEAVRALSDRTDSHLSKLPRSEASRERLSEVYYKNATTLLEKCPVETIDALLKATPLVVRPTRLLASFSLVAPRSEGARKEIRRYLERVLSSSESREQAQLEHEEDEDDTSVHNLYFQLCLGDAEAAERLLAYFEREMKRVRGPSFDAAHCLRLVESASPRIRQTLSPKIKVWLLDALGAYEEAVGYALESELPGEAAGIAAAKSERDVALGKTLWLILAREAIRRAPNEQIAVNQALAVLSASRNVLRIEDLLPSLPSNVAIVESLRDEVCAGLERNNRAIEELKAEMEEHVASTAAMRRDFLEEESRFDVLTSKQTCDGGGLCVAKKKGPLCRSIEDVVAFPCTHAFHESCLVSLWKRSSASSSMVGADLTATCPLCGDLAASAASEPILFSEDDAEARHWDVLTM